MTTQHTDLKSFGLLYGSSAPMLRLYEEIECVAQTDTTTLIIGESGTGKELIAQTIHALGPRQDQPFIALNCGAIPDSLLEAEFFGHQKGSFTGATKDRPGYFELAHGGTLFLDEVTEMSLTQQVKLLRVLETGVFYRVGGTEPIHSNIRIIAATNRDPMEAVEENLLRQDLLYRLAVFLLQAPPLSERGGDCELLAQYFLNGFNQEKGTDKKFSARSVEVLNTYKWPGNVRELKNVVYRSFILAQEDEIDIELPDTQLASSPPSDKQTNTIDISIGTPLVDAQRGVILATLEHCGGDKQRAARTLGVSLKTLYNRLGDKQHAHEKMYTPPCLE